VIGAAGARDDAELGGVELDGAERLAMELDAALARTAEATWRELHTGGALRPEAAAAGPPRLAFPAALRAFLARAVATERAAGQAGDAAAAERAAQLVRHYTEAMPRMRIAQLAGTEEPGATLFHAPLDWARMPRLGAAIDRLFGVLAAAGVAATAALGAASADAFRARTPTLAALYARTHYGGVMPLLYGAPADLAYIHAQGIAAGLDGVATIDRYLTAPIIHELCHLAADRRAVAPPHLDECIAGWLGVHVHAPLAYPPPGELGDALYAAPWLAQVGQAIARAFGVTALVRAHAGDLAALPPGFLAAAARLGWTDWCARRTLHFLADAFEPAAWLALALADAPPEDPELDRAIVEDALRAMCLTTLQIAGSFRTRAELPDGPVAIDAVGRAVIAPRGRALDPVAPRYWLPPAVAHRIAAHGGSGYELRLAALAAIPAAAAAICDAPAAGAAGTDFALIARR